MTIADLHPQKSTFYHKRLFTVRLQINPLFESLGDFDYGEALIAVLENRDFEKDEISETKKVKKSKFSKLSPEVLGRFIWVRNDVKQLFHDQNRDFSENR